MGKRKKQPKQSVVKIEQPKPENQLLKNPSISLEIDKIVGTAQKRGAHIVTTESFVFFSTETGDAWMLDPREGFSLCLVHDGKKQEFAISETSRSFSIGWNSDFRIKGSIFMVAERSGYVRSIIGYPTKQIEEAIQKMGL